MRRADITVLLHALLCDAFFVSILFLVVWLLTFYFMTSVSRLSCVCANDCTSEHSQRTCHVRTCVRVCTCALAARTCARAVNKHSTHSSLFLSGLAFVYMPFLQESTTL